jgi:hypothetical protein
VRGNQGARGSRPRQNRLRPKHRKLVDELKARGILQVAEKAGLAAFLKGQGVLQPSAASAMEQTGGINLPGTTGNIGGDVTGKDKITYVQTGIFIQGVDANAALNLYETLDIVSRASRGAHHEAEPHSTYEHPAYQAAMREAQRMCDVGQGGDASRIFMEVLEDEERTERQRQEQRRRFRVNLLEAAIVYDGKALKAEAAVVKLRLIAELTFPNDENAQKNYLLDRASAYHELGTNKGDATSLYIAASAFRWLAKGAIDGQR